MSKIRSKKAKEYIYETIPWAYMTLAVKAIQLAEQEAEERHAKDIQGVHDMYKQIFVEHEQQIDSDKYHLESNHQIELQELRDRERSNALDAFKKWLIEHYTYEDNGTMINKQIECFTQKLTEKQ